jgi:hypothetical protein
MQLFATVADAWVVEAGGVKYTQPKKLSPCLILFDVTQKVLDLFA